MTEEQHRRWDILIKGGGFLGLIISACIGVYQYQDIRKRELAQFSDMKEREYYSVFWNERLRLYVKTLDVAAKISTATSLEESEDARREFRTLFDGSMAVVQDPVVDAAIHELADKIRLIEAQQMEHDELGVHSYGFGRICYKSLKTSWEKAFGESDLEVALDVESR